MAVIMKFSTGMQRCIPQYTNINILGKHKAYSFRVQDDEND
jgi:hypothetical protein